MSDVLGRERELAVLSEVAAGSAAAAVAIEGDAGIGKTTLWRWTLEEARRSGRHVLAARPAAAEAKLSFACLRDMLGESFEAIAPALPSPQRRALAVALLVEDPGSAGPDAGAVAAGFLSAVRALAEQRPVLIAVDDVQWLDRPSAAALEFVLRRIEEEPVSLVATVRSSHAQELPLRLPAHAQILALGPLPLGALHAVLRERLHVSLPRPVLRRIHETAAGNPFLALELARALYRRGGRIRPGEVLPVPSTAERLIGERLQALPGAARSLLLVAAALSDPTVGVVTPAVGTGAEELLQRCTAANVLELEGERLRFVHPLLAAAVIEAASPAERRRVHGLLARLVRDPEERARHRALASVGPNERVAAELEAAARLARSRGAPGAAAELAEQALHLTPRGRRGNAFRRAVHAAGHLFEAGDAAGARDLLEGALAAAPPGAERAEVLVRLARVRGWSDDQRAATALYQEAAEEEGASEETRIEADGGLAISLMRLLEDLPRAARHAAAAVELTRKRDEPRLLAEHLSRQALVETLRGRPGWLRPAAEAAEIDLRTAARGEPDPAVFLRGLDAPFTLGVVHAFDERLSEAQGRFAAARRHVEELGTETSLPLLLRYQAYIAWLAGDWATAAAAAAEGHDVAVQTGQLRQQGVLAGTRALLAAHLGDEQAARAAAEEAFELAERTGGGLGFGRLLAGWGLGVLELSRDNPAAAHERLGPLLGRLEVEGVRHPGVTRFAVDDVEALVRIGRVGEAEALLDRVERRARNLRLRGMLACCERCRALLAGDANDAGGAIAALERAQALHERVAIPFERARTLLLLGGAYRRDRRKRLARETIGRAVAEFDWLGASLWSRHARAELGRVGGRPAAGGLTPTERRVAELVAEGLSNKQVAAALFVAPKTVDVTLSRIYGKLGVHSRMELAHRLPKL